MFLSVSCQTQNHTWKDFRVEETKVKKVKVQKTKVQKTKAEKQKIAVIASLAGTAVLILLASGAR